MLHKHNVYGRQENRAQTVATSQTNRVQEMLTKAHTDKLQYRAGELVQVSVSQGKRSGVHMQVWYS